MISREISSIDEVCWNLFTVLANLEIIEFDDYDRCDYDVVVCELCDYWEDYVR